MPELYTVPTPTWEAWNKARSTDPAAILPMPGEPVVPGPLPGDTKVWAHDGAQVGWYIYQQDTFHPAN